MAQETQSGHTHAAEAADKQLYQCSMHPNIVSDKPGNCPICGMELQPVRKADAAGIPGRGAVDLTDQQRQLVNIRTVAVKTSNVDRSVRAVGVVTYDQSKVADLNSRVMGWVEKLFVDTPGAHVEAGQPLMELYSPDLYSAKQDFLLAWRNARKAKGARGEYGATRASGADSVLESARKRLELFGITDEQINALETSGTAKPTMEIVAPFAGTVLQKEVVAGKMIQPTAMLYRIADLSRVWVEAEIYEYELPLVKVGQQAEVTLTAYPDRTFTGKVDFIYPYLQGQTRTAKIRVVLDNPDGVLKPDMYANVELKADLGRELVIPASALFDTGKRQYVFVQQEKGLFVPKEIQLGPKVGDDFVVRKGLATGEKVVVNGNFLLDSESQLKAAASGSSEADNKTDAAQTEAAPLPKAAAPVATAVIDAYKRMYEPLTRDSTAGVFEAAADFKKQLDRLKDPALAPPQRAEDFAKQLNIIERCATAFRAGEDLTEARKQFGELSSALVDLFKAYPPPLAAPLTVFHCPMWKQSRADWMQADATAKNPFMGTAMTSCGEAQGQIGNAGEIK